MDGDICPYCDGSGERDFLSGASCYACHGTGWYEVSDIEDMSDEELEDYERTMDEFYASEDEQEQE